MQKNVKIVEGAPERTVQRMPEGNANRHRHRRQARPHIAPMISRTPINPVVAQGRGAFQDKTNLSPKHRETWYKWLQVLDCGIRITLQLLASLSPQ